MKSEIVILICNFFSCVNEDQCNSRIHIKRRTDEILEDNTQLGLADSATCANPDHVCCSITPPGNQVTRKTTFGEWPNTCLIFEFGTDTVIGGASLITPNSLLTAAHKIEYVFLY